MIHITEASIFDDLFNNKINLVYQPIYDLKTGKVIAYEALTRWNKDNPKIYNPGTLFSLVETYQSKLIVDTLLKQAAIDQSELNIPVHFNLCYFELYYPLAHHNLSFELTENIIIDNIIDLVIDFCSKHDVFIDDCFSNYSALKWIPKLNLKGVKIDKFITDRLNEWSYQALLYYFTRYSHKLNLLVCAEGIETQEQLNTIKTLGVDLGQGYFLSKPYPKEHFLTNISN